MAIAFDSSAKNSGITSASFSHTCTGANLVLFVAARTQSNLGSITGVTYNGVALTLINTSTSAGDNNQVSLWYLMAPATGTNTVIVSASAGVSATDGVSSSYTGVNQTSIPNASNINSTTSGSPLSTSVTTTVDGCWTILAAACDSSGLAASTGSTLRNIQSTRTGLFDSNAPITPSGSSTMSVTFTSSNCATVMASFAQPSITFTANISETQGSADTNPVQKLVHSIITETQGLSEVVTVIRAKILSIIETIASSDIATLLFKWIRQSKNTSAMTNGTKHASSWTDQNKDSSNFINQNKS